MQEELFATPPGITMTALTLWPEWLPTITHMDKNVENRSWPPPNRIIGTRIALHAGKSIGGGSARHGIEWLCETADDAGWEVRPDRRLTVIGGVAGPDEWLEFRRPGAEVWSDARIHLGAVVATAEINRATRRSESLWAMEDNWHWVLRDVRVLPKPVPMRGRQGLWSCSLTAEQLGDA